MRKSSRGRDRTSIENRALIGARSLVDRMRTLYRELERLTDAPITLHRALLCVGEEPGIAASQLASRLGMKRPAVSQVLKNLTARGWIERRRSDADQRSVRIFVTTEGRQILKLTSGRAVGILKRAVQALSGDELQRFATGVEALLENLPAERSPTQALRTAVADDGTQSSKAIQPT
jgi:DNA-binding MarR family transcriptional regulator